MVLLIASALLVARAQTRSFAENGVEFSLDLPSPNWAVVPPLEDYRLVAFINGGNELNGYLRVRKNLVEEGATPATQFLRDEKQMLQLLPGYIVDGSYQGDRVNGNLNGESYSYEYTKGGGPMAGRIYYLQVDKRTFYSLHFTGARDRLRGLRNQMDQIARSFRLKRPAANLISTALMKGGSAPGDGAFKPRNGRVRANETSSPLKSPRP